jgi:hypothetical protein
MAFKNLAPAGIHEGTIGLNPEIYFNHIPEHFSHSGTPVVEFGHANQTRLATMKGNSNLLLPGVPTEPPDTLQGRLKHLVRHQHRPAPPA